MSDARRYNEQEIAAIFKQAAADQEAAHQARPSGTGLTLAELEHVGREAGIDPAFIARAAAAVDRPRPASQQTTVLGFPVSVARTADLPGEFTDKDWDLLVADLHDTFHVHGEIQEDGTRRRWHYGNLQALVEPTEAGHRLRLRTLSDRARTGLIGGLTFFAMGLFFMAILIAKGDAAALGKMLFTSLWAVVGLGSMGVSAYQLPRWRSTRTQQLDGIAARAIARSATPAPTSPVPTSTPAPHLNLDEAVPPATERVPTPRNVRS